jgi:hypothetical protein
MALDKSMEKTPTSSLFLPFELLQEIFELVAEAVCSYFQDLYATNCPF